MVTSLRALLSEKLDVPAHPNNLFADLLRHYRSQLGWTQERLAKQAGLSVYGIQKLERGATHPYRETAQRRANALELSAAERAHFLGVVVPVRRWNSIPANGGNGEIHDNLAAELTSFVGREADIASVAKLVAASRLVTHTGTGGVGKAASRSGWRPRSRISFRIVPGSPSWHH